MAEFVPGSVEFHVPRFTHMATPIKTDVCPFVCSEKLKWLGPHLAVSRLSGMPLWVTDGFWICTF